MQRARRPLPDHHQRHEGRTLGARLRRRPPRTDLATGLRLRPGPAARPLPAPWPPATCGSAPARVSPAHRGAAPGSAGSPGGRLFWGYMMPLDLSPLIVPGDGTVSFPWGPRAPAPKFSIVCRWTECPRPAEAGCLGGHLIPWGTGRGLFPAVGRSPPTRETGRDLPLPCWLSGPPGGDLSKLGIN